MDNVHDARLQNDDVSNPGPSPSGISSPQRPPRRPYVEDEDSASMPSLSDAADDSETEDVAGQADMSRASSSQLPSAPPLASTATRPPAAATISSHGVFDEFHVQATPSRTRRRADSDAGSVASLPSLQTVSDSSDDDEGEWTDDESVEDEDDDDEDEDEDEDDFGDPHAFRYFESQLGALVDDQTTNPSGLGVLPPGTSRLIDSLRRAVAETRDIGFIGPGARNDDIDGMSVFDNAIAGLMNAGNGGANARTSNFVETMRQMLENLRGPAMPESDPKRAETIMEALEVVPEDLVRRYEKLRAGRDGDPCEGCAVCREGFLEPPTAEENTVAVQLAELPYPACEVVSDILAFPCPGMHLFHSQCLSPWLGRKTTCPTCRYDVDPESLTLTFLQDLRARSADPLATKKWAPPKGRGFRKWLEREERKLAGGGVSEDDADTGANSDDELPALIPDQFASGTRAAPRPAPSSAPRPARPAFEPLQMPPPEALDPITRERMLAAMLPLMGMDMGLELGDDPFASFGDEDEEDGEDEEDWDEEEELPELVPAGRPVGPSPSRPSHPSVEDDEELPALVNEESSSSRPTARPPPATRPPPAARSPPQPASSPSGGLFFDFFPTRDTPGIPPALAHLFPSSHGMHEDENDDDDDDDDDDDEMPALVPVGQPVSRSAPATGPAAPPTVVNDDADEDDEMPELIPVGPRAPASAPPRSSANDAENDDSDDELPTLVPVGTTTRSAAAPHPPRNTVRDVVYDDSDDELPDLVPAGTRGARPAPTSQRATVESDDDDDDSLPDLVNEPPARRSLNDVD